MKRAVGRRRQLAVALLAGALVASACTSQSSGPEADSEGTEASNQVGIIGVKGDPGDPVAGGTLSIAALAEARSLDPTKTISTGASGGIALAAVYDVLMRYNPAEQSYEPWLAKSLTSSEGNKTWTLTLRDGVKFSDGSTLDARAVVGSIQYYLENRGYGASLLAPSLESMQAKGNSTVVFQLKRPWSGFPSMLAQGPGMIVAPAAIDSDEFEPIGAGPFALTRYAPGEELILAKRAEYWRGAPHLDRLRFVWYQAPDAKLEALKSGAVDLAFLLSPKVIDAAKAAGFGGFITTVSLGSIVWINNREGMPGADPRVRKAVAYALNPQAYYDRVYDGAGMPGKDLFQAFSRWHAPDAKPFPVDLEKAKQLLSAAKADGYDGKISYLEASDPASRAGAVMIKAMLEKVGFTVTLDFVRSITAQTRRTYVDHDFDLVASGTSIRESNPYQGLFGGLHSESSVNASGYTSPEMDKLLSQLQVAATVEEKRAVIADIERLWWDTVPGVPTAASARFLPWQENVHGVVPTASTMLLFGDAWIAK